MRPSAFAVLFLVPSLFLVSLFAAEQPAMANSDPVYQQLRHIAVSAEAVSVNDFVLTRDGATFTFKSGTFSLLAPVAGKVTGAVFSGEGEFSLLPPLPMERRQLTLLTKSDSLRETFRSLVLRFTDDTAARIKAAGSQAQAAANAADQLKDVQDALRKKLKYNLDARILQDVLSAHPGALFLAFIHGGKYSGKELFTVDPHGAIDVAPEEVSFATYDENKTGIWAAYHLAAEYKNGQAKSTQVNACIDITHHVLDTKIERSGMLRGNAKTTFTALGDGLRVVYFNLFPTLRVQQATADGKPLAFIQEKKDEDADFWVILPRALKAGETFTLQTVYEGKDAVSNEGFGNYYPVARDNWYPNSSFGDYATYDMTFTTHKGLKLVATGVPVKEFTEGNQTVTVWKSEAPQAVAGFNLGEFKIAEARMKTTDYTVQAYANAELPDFARALHASTVSMMKKPLAEAQVAVRLYTDYFGPSAYKHIAMTEQTACNYGQSWPELVYLPICSFFDDTIKHDLGLTDLRGYWRVVAPHEVAHQWWGHTVGFNSYRDQWMSEGFSDFSASLFIQLVWKNHKDYIRFWHDERELITEKNRQGFRPIEVGPLTMGYRLNTTRTGSVARHLIYPKGAYILQMIRMMMWDGRTGDSHFRLFMTDFVKTYTNRIASTEDFKAMLEKYMTPGMDLDGNHRMDWFFNEWVYGTALPKYQMESSFGRSPDGAITLKFTARQSNVDDSFMMLVPIYVELADGRVVLLGRLRMRGNSTVEQEVQLRGLKQVPVRALLNYNADVLVLD